jgi:hypothetical protein
LEARVGVEKKKRYVKSAEFLLGEGKSLIISLSFAVGLDRIIIENKNGLVCVNAEGHSRFEFDDKQHGPNQCDFWLANPSLSAALGDYLDGRFWSQFTWGDLSKYQHDPKLKKALKTEIQKLTTEFESKAARRLNGILKKHKIGK